MEKIAGMDPGMMSIMVLDGSMDDFHLYVISVGCKSPVER